AVDQQVGRVVIHGEVGADATAPEPARITGRREGVDPTEELAVATDVAERVDAGRAVLTAPLHDFGGEGQMAIELTDRAGVRRVQMHRERRIDTRDRRVLVPGRAQIEEARALHLPDELLDPAGVVPAIVGAATVGSTVVGPGGLRESLQAQRSGHRTGYTDEVSTVHCRLLVRRP